MSRDEGDIKQTLDFLLDQTFSDSAKYKKYFVSIQPKELKSKHGHYEEKEAKIVVYNLSRDHEHTLMTCLHELTHHIQLVNEGETDHESGFYTIYYQIIQTALSYGYLSKKGIVSEVDSSDVQLLQELFGVVDGWPVEKKYVDGKIIFSVKTDKKFKEFLRLRGFNWYSLAQSWQKTCANRSEAKVEWLALREKIPEKDITTKHTGKVEFLAYYYIGVRNGFDFRKSLEELGFVWEGYGIDKQWVKRVKAQEYYEELSELTLFAGIECKKVTPDFEKERRKLLKKEKMRNNHQKKIVIIE